MRQETPSVVLLGKQAGGWLCLRSLQGSGLEQLSFVGCSCRLIETVNALGDHGLMLGFGVWCGPVNRELFTKHFILDSTELLLDLLAAMLSPTPENTC